MVHALVENRMTILVVGLILLAIPLGAGMFFLATTDSAVVTMHPQYVADFADDKVLVGASHNVFVGKVIAQSGTKQLGATPETQFSVEIIRNVKGELQGVVTVNQQGGYKDGVLYITESGDVSAPGKGERYMLQNGSTYLFATRYNESENWHTLNTFPTARKFLSADQGLSQEQLATVAVSDARVRQLYAAYPDEVLLEADIKAKNILNSFESLSFDEKQAVHNVIATDVQ